MNNGKPNWWSRPSSAPEAARIPSPPPADDVTGPRAGTTDGDGDFPLPAPQPQAGEPDGTDVTDSSAPAAGPDSPTDGPEAPTVVAPTVASAPEPTVLLTKGEPAAPADMAALAGTVAPAAGAPAAPALTDTVPAPETPSADAPSAEAPAQGAPQPLHAPDEYRTPPYGEPGPWAPAPPVQRPPAPVPPQQAHVPPAHPQPHPAPHTHPQGPPQAHPPAGGAPWMQYDPWGGGGAVLPPAPAKKSRKGLAVAGALVFALVTGVIGGGIGAYVERNGGITTVELPQADAEDTGRAPDSVAGIAASALPGVVTLHVKGNGSSGTGTGFVLDTKGHILTNNHVVDGAASSEDITVTFSSGESARAKLIGKDTGYDLAVVQVTGVSGLKPLPLGNSDNVRVGDPVVAIGAPFDLSNTVTSGIISAKERPITAGGEKGDGTDISYVDALQTDAPINPGNSGGPLLDSKARVVGINSAIRAAGGSGEGEGAGASQPGSIGLGFAIPINQGKRVAEELINTGKASHPVIGVSLDMQFNGDGARVGEKGKDGSASVTPGGPAAQAGLRPGDVITKVDGQRVHNGEELIVKIRAHRPGDKLALTLTRNGKELTKTLTLGSSQGT
ncbi:MULTISPECIES: trypsin-like peptidase domain-containing protein [unclassified Streptomyces]|uniref:S1C family serine protease n=1 Tax=unclassified Streptomyces TaxID=2593676 RepID=UPI0006FEAC1C|nr:MULTISPECIES: trypsin-like peptidase domain-containing protein [unclassified Streptomyces]KQX58786.1 protease [Streptomyces sp. Root1304]KRB00047.1 protease [Streptomyces sp. Root66D1]